MKQTPKHMKKLSLAKTVSAPLWTFSMGLLILCLSACAGTPKFPARFLIEYDAKNGVCGKYQVVNPELLQFAYVGDVPCPSVFGFDSKDIPRVMDWARARIQDGKKKCSP